MDFAPMLASTLDPPVDLDGWAIEVKWDGVRAVGRCGPDGIRIRGRNGTDVTARYPELHGIGSALAGREVVLDGEIVAFDAHGAPDFGAVLERARVEDPATARRLAPGHPITWVLFDLLAVDGRPIIDEPYEQRRERLEALDLDGAAWSTPGTWPGGRLDRVRAATAESGLEGMVLKRLASPYRPGRRSPDWRKVKHRRTQEAVVVGWTERRSGPAGDLGALVLAVPVDGHDDGFVFVGSVGSGLDEPTRHDLLRRMASLETPDPPVVDVPGFDMPVHWVRPRIVVEVAHTGWTDQGRLRQPSYRGLRIDKKPGEVRREP